VGEIVKTIFFSTIILWLISVKVSFNKDCKNVTIASCAIIVLVSKRLIYSAGYTAVAMPPQDDRPVGTNYEDKGPKPERGR
jgi:hypothetical protein